MHNNGGWIKARTILLIKSDFGKNISYKFPEVKIGRGGKSVAERCLEI